MWIHQYIKICQHSLREHLFNLADTVDMNDILECLQQDPKSNLGLKDACIFFEKLKCLTLNMKKKQPLPNSSNHCKRFFDQGVKFVV